VNWETETTAPQRAGVAFYFEPELAIALRNGSETPMPSERGEQYAVAAMLWSLVAGEHYLDFSLERAELLRQIIEDGPRPMRRPWAPLEDVLRVALEKDPSRRYPTMRDFANAIADLTIPRARKQSHDLFERLSEASPYFAYRLALERGDAELLALADVASTNAVRPDDELSNVVHALIAAARGDERTKCSAIRDFARVATSLRAVTVLLDEDPALRELGDALHHRMWISAGPSPHWSVVEASLAWSQATVEPPDPRALARLAQLRDEAIPTGRGVRWSWNGADSLAGWCNGSAGFVQLWLTANDVALAESAAWHAWETEDDDTSLCCGPAARALALLALHRRTGDRVWRDRANILAGRITPDAIGVKALVIAALGV
jgi:serine/threonine-protein kinase